MLRVPCSTSQLSGVVGIHLNNGGRQQRHGGCTINEKKT